MRPLFMCKHLRNQWMRFTRDLRVDMRAPGREPGISLLFSISERHCPAGEKRKGTDLCPFPCIPNIRPGFAGATPSVLRFLLFHRSYRKRLAAHRLYRRWSVLKTHRQIWP